MMAHFVPKSAPIQKASLLSRGLRKVHFVHGFIFIQSFLSIFLNLSLFNNFLFVSLSPSTISNFSLQNLRICISTLRLSRSTIISQPLQFKMLRVARFDIAVFNITSDNSDPAKNDSSALINACGLSFLLMLLYISSFLFLRPYLPRLL